MLSPRRKSAELYDRTREGPSLQFENNNEETREQAHEEIEKKGEEKGGEGGKINRRHEMR
jgi:hypothetical protein